MENVTIQKLSDVWGTIRRLPTGQTTIVGTDEVLKDVHKCVVKYSTMYEGMHGKGNRPLKCHYVGSLRPGMRTNSMTVHVKVHQWEAFEPQRNLKTTVRLALETLRAGELEEVMLKCEREQIPQVRNYVSGCSPQVSVLSAPGGCTMKFKYEDNSAIVVYVQECLMALSNDMKTPIHVLVDPSERKVAARYIAKIASEKGVRISMRNSDKYIAVTVKPAPLPNAVDDFIEKWTSKGYHQAELLDEFTQGVERYRKSLYADDFVRPIPVDDEQDNLHDLPNDEVI